MAEQRSEWVVERDDAGCYIIDAVLGGQDHGVMVYVGNNDPEQQAEDLARKLNTHSDLLAACEAYQAAEDHHDNCSVCDPEHWCEVGGELYNDARQLRKAAVVKARGGKADG